VGPLVMGIWPVVHIFCAVVCCTLWRACRIGVLMLAVGASRPPVVQDTAGSAPLSESQELFLMLV